MLGPSLSAQTRRARPAPSPAKRVQVPAPHEGWGWGWGYGDPCAGCRGSGKAGPAASPTRTSNGPRGGTPRRSRHGQGTRAAPPPPPREGGNGPAYTSGTGIPRLRRRGGAGVARALAGCPPFGGGRPPSTLQKAANWWGGGVHTPRSVRGSGRAKGERCVGGRVHPSPRACPFGRSGMMRLSVQSSDAAMTGGVASQERVSRHRVGGPMDGPARDVFPGNGGLEKGLDS
mmetsp:Transcript_89347/g.154695  ORF Transcript_89347/g.154695 Transcript_89347/m.154695 type:complete len:230 (-) Transcript_89347:1690-2379(-)